MSYFCVQLFYFGRSNVAHLRSIVVLLLMRSIVARSNVARSNVMSWKVRSSIQCSNFSWASSSSPSNFASNTLIIACVVECALRNPNWHLFNIPLLYRKASSLFLSIFSKIFWECITNCYRSKVSYLILTRFEDRSLLSNFKYIWDHIQGICW